jgi:hypothetical protein
MKSAAITGILLFSSTGSTRRPTSVSPPDRTPDGTATPNPGGSHKGRHLLWGALLVMAALVIIAARGWILRQPALTGHSLVTITEIAAAEGADPAAPRSWIGLSGAGSDSVEVLTDRFWSASSPAPSFDGRRFLFRGRKSETGSPALWEMQVDGRGLRLVTRGLGDPDDPLYLPDGRILFSDIPPDESGPAAAIRSLFSSAPDGSDLERLTFGNHHDGRPDLAADGRIRFLRLTGTGRVARPAMTMTINADGTGLARFVAAEGTDNGTRSGAPPAPGDNRRIAEVVDASARRPPAVRTLVAEETSSTGSLLCINAYLSDLPGINGLSAGEIRKVRVARAGFAGMDTMGRPKPAEVLAEAEVFADGSFFVEVPADTPLQLLLLGDHDRPLAAHEHGIWVRPEENRGCIGCHENRGQVPEERLPLALQRGMHGDGGPGESHAR